MSPDEANTLMQVMSNKISELTQQNVMLESKVMYLNSVVQQLQNSVKQLQSSSEQNDGGNYDEEPSVKQNNGKTKQQVTT